MKNRENFSNPTKRRRLGKHQHVNETQAPSTDAASILFKDEEDCNIAETKAKLARFIASSFVRRDGKFYRIESPTVSMSATDLKRVSLHRVNAAYPDLELTDELWSAVCAHAINDTHTVQGESVPVWDGTQRCAPGTADGLIWHDGMASLNSWKNPPYRQIGTEEQNDDLLDQLLERLFPQPADRAVFKDWLAWNLQNESNKPTWAIMLYSQTKGTGKSTLGRLLSQLFGEDNSMTINGISQLTGRFNKPILTRKFVVCEEVKLGAGTDAGNKIKALISERVIAAEGKGTNAESMENSCCFLMTTNHYPHWIEPDDRRFYVIDVNHRGHASGAEQEQFHEFMTECYSYMENPENIAKLRNALMAHRPANSFNAKSLNVAAIDTPIMQRICQDSGEVLQQILDETITAQGVYALPLASLVKLFSERLKINPNRISHMMSEMNWRPVKAKWGGTDSARVAWVHPDYQLANGRVRGPNGYDEAINAAEEEVELI